MRDRAPRRVTVYVDAKIINMHDPSLPRAAYVGYKVRGGGSAVEQVEAAESDDAEVLAILFAIRRLKAKFERMTIVCDHQSVVSEANRAEVRRPSRLMATLRETLRGDPSVKLRALQANPAHGVVTEYVNSVESAAGKDA